jgi:DNA-binding beta-propeller fold protein YncE
MRRFLPSLLGCFALGVCAQQPPTLKLIQTIPLPGVKGRFDHFAIDGKGQRLFVAALGNNTLEVLDVSAGNRIKSLAGLHKPTGVLYLAEQNRIAVANGDDGMFKVFDGISYELVNSVGSLDDADNVRYDAKTKLIYIGYTDGALSIIDSATMKQIASIKLAAHPESFQLEANSPRVFVNVPDAKQVAAIDREKRTVTATWPMTEFKANFPMALDEASHRVFIGCRQPARLVVLDTSTGKLLANVETSGDTDDLFYDAKRQRIYTSCGEGFLEVIQRRDGDRFERLARLATRPGARTSFFSSDLDRLYLAVPQRNGRDAEIRIFQPE